ncbi:NACHT, LRR and PYD domains-containing protein 12-like isoform X2 [Colossoma macropomum]|nr:NACHT, LRR and PYD domains-containing protein 12-like isoform X2 [Colossoma macropomum]
MFHPPAFSKDRTATDPIQQKSRADSPEPSCVSKKSDHSMFHPPAFSKEGTFAYPRWGKDVQLLDQSSCGLCHHLLTEPVSITCGHSFCRHCISSFWDHAALPGEFDCPQCLVLHPHKASMEQDCYQPMDDVLQRVFESHKTSMKIKYESLFEGIQTQENKTLLNRIYTQLYIIEGESEGVNEEHEVFQMEKTSRFKHIQDTPINCVDIFKPAQYPKVGIEEEIFRFFMANERKENIQSSVVRTVLTKGIAGIGKTVSVQKFILDWVEGKANQNIEFMFVLPFRELNLIKDLCSLHGLLSDFYPEVKDLDPKIYDECKAVFIFDGLDESRISLDFELREKVSDMTMMSSVNVLMTNLIKGELLPTALIWITSRPAAANQIPPKYINRVTEIQGFNDPQKEEYFRKRISDEDQANKIISHIKTARSLHIMCHIPVFCWISATVLQQIMKHNDTEIPKTLTEMYAHFLLTQRNMKNEKYEEKDERDPKNLLESNRTILLNLAELAFKQLMKGNVMFYEEDLRECGIDVTEASVYSGICTEIFKEECVLYQRKVYCFVHLSFQEFLAAFFVFHCYESKNMETLQCFKPLNTKWSENVLLEDLLMGAVDKALESENGHLDLFLRFLLGISLESNQRLLQGLLTHTESSSESINKIIKYIQKQVKGENEVGMEEMSVMMRNLMMEVMKQRKRLPTERSINLYLCLFEMNDQSLSREIKDYLKSEEYVDRKLSPGQCSTLACMLHISEEVLDELDLKKYNASEEGYRRLIPAITNCRKAMIDGCYLTMDSCEILASVLQSEKSFLKELDLSNNDLQDSGVELLSDGLKSSNCKLEKLRLAGCNLNMNSCEILTSIVQSANSSLRDLDLSNNDVQDAGVELLSPGLCKLEILRLAICNLGGKACENLGTALQLVNSSLKELDLSNNDVQDSGVKLLSAGLMSSHCKLKTLRLSGCMVTDEGFSSLASTLKSSPSNLKELDLTYNHPGESGVKMLSDLLEDPQYQLEKLRMEHAGMLRIKPGLRKYVCDLNLDPNTAHIFLSLSEGNKKVTCVKEHQPYPDHPDRFDECVQVLCTEGLTGRCYWETEWTGEEVAIAMTYKTIIRKGESDECKFGWNEKAWSLCCFYDPEDSEITYAAWHNKKDTAILDPPSFSNRVGVYLDWVAGTLSFYSVSPDTHILTHLHTFQTTFTEPLHAGFRVWDGSSVYVCQME